MPNVKPFSSNATSGKLNTKKPQNDSSFGPRNSTPARLNSTPSSRPSKPESGRRTLAKPKEARREERVLEGGPFSIDLKTHEALCEGRLLELTPREYRLLAHLMEQAPRVVGPKELVRVVGRYECEYLYEARRIIKWYVHRLRQKVEPDPSRPRYILTVRGVGYRFGVSAPD